MEYLALFDTDATQSITKTALNFVAHALTAHEAASLLIMVPSYSCGSVAMRYAAAALGSLAHIEAVKIALNEEAFEPG